MKKHPTLLGVIQEKSTVDVSDTFSVYSFEFDSSKHKYQTGADQVGKNLDALGEDLMEEEDNIDEDLDAAVVIIESAPKQVSKQKFVIFIIFI